MDCGLSAYSSAGGAERMGLRSWLQRRKSEAVIGDCDNDGCEQWTVNNEL